MNLFNKAAFVILNSPFILIGFVAGMIKSGYLVGSQLFDKWVESL